MENLLANLAFALSVFGAMAYVNGFRETFRAIRSIRIPRIRLSLPDAFKRDAQSFARLRVAARPHPMDRTFNQACDW